jgi:hypothetical protein
MAVVLAFHIGRFNPVLRLHGNPCSPRTILLAGQTGWGSSIRWYARRLMTSCGTARGRKAQGPHHKGRGPTKADRKGMRNDADRPQPHNPQGTAVFRATPHGEKGCPIKMTVSWWCNVYAIISSDHSWRQIANLGLTRRLVHLPNKRSPRGDGWEGAHGCTLGA